MDVPVRNTGKSRWENVERPRNNLVYKNAGYMNC